jgi:hypothetical protein
VVVQVHRATKAFTCGYCQWIPRGAPPPPPPPHQRKNLGTPADCACVNCNLENVAHNSWARCFNAGGTHTL